MNAQNSVQALQDLNSWNSFFEKYPVEKNKFDDNASLEGCMFETFGVELEYVLSLDPVFVWTYIEAEDSYIIEAGVHYVNRIGYIVSTKAIQTGDIKSYYDS